MTVTGWSRPQAAGVIPIVAVEVGSLLETGLVKSLSHPGGNVTGLSSVAVELYAKRVELIKETVPGVMRIGGLTTWVTLTLQIPGNRSRGKLSRWGSSYSFSMCANPKI